jgi:hypothetical protein
MGGKARVDFRTSCGRGAEGVVAGTGVPVTIDNLRAGDCSGTVTVAVITVVLLISSLLSACRERSHFSENTVCVITAGVSQLYSPERPSI